MKALLLTNPGCEGIAGQEASELVNAKIVASLEGGVVVECEEQDLFTLCYLGRSFVRVVLVLHQFEFETSPVERFKEINFASFASWLGKSAAVVCQRIGDHDFTSFEIQSELGSYLQEKCHIKIDYKNPETIVFVLVQGRNCWVGVDFSGVDLGRRDYRIFLGPDSIKGNIAYVLLRLSGYKAEHVLLDPFCRDGIIPIEAALMATNTSVHKFGKEKFAFLKIPKFKSANFDELFAKLDSREEKLKGEIYAVDTSFKAVQHARKNAKIAGVVKEVSFSRQELRFLDAKFGKAGIDRIVTVPLQPGKAVAEEFFRKVIHEFFYQADFILKKDGKVVLCMSRGVEVAKAEAQTFKFGVEHERTISQGDLKFQVIVFSKQSF